MAIKCWYSSRVFKFNDLPFSAFYGRTLPNIFGKGRIIYFLLLTKKIWQTFIQIKRNLIFFFWNGRTNISSGGHTLFHPFKLRLWAFWVQVHAYRFVNTLNFPNYRLVQREITCQISKKLWRFFVFPCNRFHWQVWYWVKEIITLALNHISSETINEIYGLSYDLLLIHYTCRATFCQHEWNRKQ